MKCSGLSTAPTYHFPVLYLGEEVEEGRCGKGGFSLLLISYSFYVLVLGNKLYSSPYAESVLPVTVIGE